VLGPDIFNSMEFFVLILVVNDVAAIPVLALICSYLCGWSRSTDENADDDSKSALVTVICICMFVSKKV
jgi:hypothetical protein